MSSVYDFDKLSKLLSSLFLLTNRKVTLMSRECNSVISSNSCCEFCKLIQNTPYGYEKCVSCDMQALERAKQKGGDYLYRCHAGLMEAAIPILENDRLLGYLMYGQVLDETPRDVQWGQIERLCSWHQDLKALKEAFLKLDQLELRTLHAYSDILSACAAYIWLRDYIKQREPDAAQILLSYIENNYARPLTLSAISAELGIGKSKLCELAKTNFSCSVQHLIRQQRVEVAKKLLTSEDLPISIIAERVGIEDSNYFVKVFKAAAGCTPSNYKKLMLVASRHTDPTGINAGEPQND